MTTPTVPVAPILGHVEAVELVDTGTWLASTGIFTATAEHLASAVAALECPAVRRPVLKAGHDGRFGVGEPALGYVANLRVDNDGQTLIGDYRGMPAWLTEVDDAGQSVLASAYPDRSVECEHNYRCQLGHCHPFVVHAVAWLGVERPAIGTLQSLQEMYGVVAATTASEDGQLVALTSRQEISVPQQISASANTDDVRRAYYATPDGSGWSMWIREMYVDPMELIVDDDSNGTIVRVPYEVDADGTVTFGDPQPVKVEYVAARAAGGAPAVVFASNAESRAVLATPPSPPATPVEVVPPTPKEKPVSVLSDGLRTDLGLDAEVDEATILEAAREALAERADPPVAAQLPDGTVAVDSQTWQDTVAAAAEGRQARTAQLEQHRRGVVEAAINDGRIPPARRDSWLAQLAADPGAETVLASLEKGTVPLEPIGKTGVDAVENATAASVRESEAYKNWSTS